MIDIFDHINIIPGETRPIMHYVHKYEIIPLFFFFNLEVHKM